MSSLLPKHSALLALLLYCGLVRDVAVEPVICDGVCECEAPIVLCNFTLTGVKMPMFTSKSGYTTLLLYGNKGISSIADHTFPSSWSIQNMTIHGTSISGIYCTAFDGLKSSLRYLSLQKNSFISIPHCLIGRLAELIRLDFKYNSIRRLSNGDMFNNPDLQVLDLSFNMIESIHRQAIQSTPRLKELNLSYNKLKTLEAEQFKSLGATALDSLDLSHNEIAVLSEDMFVGIATVLKRLDVSFNKITAQTWPSSVVALQSLTNLKSLNVSGHSLSSFDARQFNGSFNFLETLSVSQCSLRTFSWEVFDDIGQLNVSGNNIESNRLQIHRSATLCSGSAGCPQIEIDITGNKVSELVILRDFNSQSKPMKIVAKNSQLKNFKLYLNNTIPTSTTYNRPRITLILSQNKLLEPVVLYTKSTPTPYSYSQKITLDLSDNNLGQIPVQPLRAFYNFSEDVEVPTCNLLREKIELDELDLSGNNISMIPAESCLIAQVKVLKLNRNQIKSLGRLMWTSGSAGYNELEELELRQNGLRTIDLDTFNGLAKLKKVDLRDNELSSVPDLSYLGSVPTFRMLQLDNNPFTCTCNLLWLQENLAIVNQPKASGRCMLPEQFEGFNLFCYRVGGGNCPTSGVPVSTTSRNKLSDYCDSDTYVGVRDFASAHENLTSLKITWRRIGPGDIYGYMPKYRVRNNLKQAQEVLLHQDSSNVTLYQLKPSTTYEICLTILIPHRIFGFVNGASACINSSTVELEIPEKSVPVAEIALGVCLGATVIVLMVVVFFFVRFWLAHRAKPNQSNLRNPHLEEYCEAKPENERDASYRKKVKDNAYISREDYIEPVKHVETDGDGAEDYEGCEIYDEASY